MCKKPADASTNPNPPTHSKRMKCGRSWPPSVSPPLIGLVRGLFPRKLVMNAERLRRSAPPNGTKDEAVARFGTPTHSQVPRRVRNVVVSAVRVLPPDHGPPGERVARASGQLWGVGRRGGGASVAE